jgi:hypothetical protein
VTGVNTIQAQKAVFHRNDVRHRGLQKSRFAPSAGPSRHAKCAQVPSRQHRAYNSPVSSLQSSASGLAIRTPPLCDVEIERDWEVTCLKRCDHGLMRGNVTRLPVPFQNLLRRPPTNFFLSRLSWTRSYRPRYDLAAFLASHLPCGR